MSAVEQPEPSERPRPGPPRSLTAFQTIRSHAIRAAATFLAADERATEDDVFALAKRIANYIEGRRSDGR